MANLKLAFGFKMGVGKDTAANYLIKKYGGNNIKISKPIYDILFYTQQKCGFETKKDRKFLQWIGTEWGRAKDNNVWINLTLKEVTTGNNYITDLRFINEFTKLKQDGWKCIRLDKIKIEPNREGSGDKFHISETELKYLPDYEWDFIINNDSTEEEFFKKLDKIVLLLSNNK